MRQHDYFAVVRSRTSTDRNGIGTLEYSGMSTDLRSAILCAEVRTILAARQGAGPWSVDYMGADGVMHPVPLDDPDYLAAVEPLTPEDSLDYAEDVLRASARELEILREAYGAA